MTEHRFEFVGTIIAIFILIILGIALGCVAQDYIMGAMSFMAGLMFLINLRLSLIMYKLEKIKKEEE